MSDRRLDKLLARGKMVEHGAAREPGGVCDHRVASGVVTHFGEQPHGGVEDSRARPKRLWGRPRRGGTGVAGDQCEDDLGRKLLA